MNNMESLNNKPIYRLVDCRGRIHLPKALRDAGDMQPGDIVRLELRNGRVSASRVQIVEETAHCQPRADDQDQQQPDTRNWQRPCRPEAVEAFVRGAIRHLPPSRQFDLAASLMELLKQEGGR